MKAQREALKLPQFEREYKKVIEVNKQNLKELKKVDNRKTETP